MKKLADNILLFVLYLFGNVIIILLILLFSNNIAAQNIYYTNPIKIDRGDPSVVRHNGKYYLYGTGNYQTGFDVFESQDLFNWTKIGDAFVRTFPGNAWGQTDFWAPEVFYYNNSFWMIYSARATDGKLNVALANSDSPKGPFINFAAPLLDSTIVCIDGHVFVDDDGQPYFYYVLDVSENVLPNGKRASQIFVVKLDKNYMRPVGEPIMCTTPDQAWEGLTETWMWNEGPHVIKNNGIYYLIYSANMYLDRDYGLGYATSNSPLGPWNKFKGNPVLKNDLSIGVSGPGHNCVIASPDSSELFVVYHCHKKWSDPSAGRYLQIDRLEFKNDTLVIKGPTRSPQLMPSGVTTLIEKKEEILNDSFKLNGVFPNPFNPTTKIKYTLNQKDNVDIKVFDLSGRLVNNLYSQLTQSGEHEVLWNGKNNRGELVNSGVYFINVRCKNYQKSVKTVFLK